MKIKRPAHLCMGFRQRPVLDIDCLRSGEYPVTFQDQLVAISILTGAEYPVTIEDVGLLSRVSCDDWISADEVGRELAIGNDRIEELVYAGLLLADTEDNLATERRRGNGLVTAQAWDSVAATYHFTSKWRDVNVWKNMDWSNLGSHAIAKRRIGNFGMPPPHFHKIAASDRVSDLPLVPGDDDLLLRLLRQRKTTREFDTSTPLSLVHLSRILYTTFGCHGYAELADSIVILKKTSPSGGASHAIEVYPLIVDVEGVPSGLYHYDVERHALVEIWRFGVEDARARAGLFAAGQDYFASASVIFVLTARFYRSFWKYRAHAKAYRALLMDAAHLSQTLYLVCTDLGLGAFVTAAINESNIEEELGLEGFEEGAIAVCGCGHADSSKEQLQPDFKEYVPRQTKINVLA